MKYTLDYFIKKFSKIPPRKWCKGGYSKNGASCVLGHLGETDRGVSPESLALARIIRGGGGSGYIVDINDGFSTEYKQKTPKGRVMAYLKDLKKGIVK